MRVGAADVPVSRLFRSQVCIRHSGDAYRPERTSSTRRPIKDKNLADIQSFRTIIYCNVLQFGDIINKRVFKGTGRINFFLF